MRGDGMTDIDEIERAHEADLALYRPILNKAALEILARESALIAKVREMEKDKKAQEVFDASRIKLISVQAAINDALRQQLADMTAAKEEAERKYSDLIYRVATCIQMNQAMKPPPDI